MSGAEALHHVLERTRVALVAGDLSALAGLAVETEAALSRLHPCDEAQLAVLATAAGQNARCLSAAAAGLAAARVRLAEIAAEGRALGYDGTGQRIGLPDRSLLSRRF